MFVFVLHSLGKNALWAHEIFLLQYLKRQLEKEATNWDGRCERIGRKFQQQRRKEIPSLSGDRINGKMSMSDFPSIPLTHTHIHTYKNTHTYRPFQHVEVRALYLNMQTSRKKWICSSSRTEIDQIKLRLCLQLQLTHWKDVKDEMEEKIVFLKQEH